MEENPTIQEQVNLAGMSAAEAREYILSFIITLKLTEKEIANHEDMADRWKRRIELARFRGRDELLAEAESEAEKINARLAELRNEKLSLTESIAAMQRQLPGLSARERSIDPDLLEQELLLALGTTGEDDGTESAFRELEKNNRADAALEELKNKLKENTP